MSSQSILAFKNILSNHRWEDIYSERNPDFIYSRFIRTFCKTDDTSLPETPFSNEIMVNNTQITNSLLIAEKCNIFL